MNQEKIGKFIAESRKNKNLTQEQLAELLMVSNRTISKWENGKGMPDYSILPSLCEKLDITINELLSGEKILDDDYQKKFEENMILNMDLLKRKSKQTFYNLIKIILCIILIFIIAFIVRTLHIEVSYKKIYLDKEIIDIDICKDKNNNILVNISSKNNEPNLVDVIYDKNNVIFKAYRYKNSKYMNDVSFSSLFLLDTSNTDTISLYDKVVFQKGMKISECDTSY